jgi:hypothetical protein
MQKKKETLTGKVTQAKLASLPINTLSTAPKLTTTQPGTPAN